jgi:DNA-binding CsgD family transcriptional regulator
MKANQTNQTNRTTREETTNRLNALMEKRNDLVKALEISDYFRTDLDKTVNELCETIAQISVYKTLLHLADSVTSFNATETTESNGHRQTISTSGAEMCEKLYRSFAHDMHLYKTGDITDIYSDAMDLFTTAYVIVWSYLKSTAPLTLDDVVLTIPKANGNEKNYTLFQTACKSIREYIHEWSSTDSYKKLHYLIGYTESGKQITTIKRPTDTLTDIDEKTQTAFFNKYGLTAKEQEILRLVVNGETAETIATLLNIPCVTVWKNIARAKAKFATASAYAEYITAKNAEKIAKAKAEKHTADRLYLDIYEKAKERTTKALQEWKTAFYKELPQD